MAALEESGMDVSEHGYQMCAGIGAESGCKISVNGKVISIFEYKAPLELHKSENAVANENLMMFEESEHPKWDSILEVFNSL